MFEKAGKKGVVRWGRNETEGAKGEGPRPGRAQYSGRVPRSYGV